MVSASLRLSPVDAAGLAAVFRIADAARDADGADPFNEQARLDVAAGRREALLIVAEAALVGGVIVGATIVGADEFDLVIAPDRRGESFGDTALTRLLPRFTGPVSAWAHGDHPAARVLATRYGFDRVRTLLQLEAPLAAQKAGSPWPGGNARLARPEQPEPMHPDAMHPDRTQPEPTHPRELAQPTATDGIRIEAFRPEVDDAEWVALNARVFAAHPEQGGVTLGDLHDRMAEDWFDAADFLVARDGTGRMVGYNWLKIEGSADAAGRVDSEHPAAPEGEIYVVGVDSAFAGHGLGRALMSAGLERLRERGCVIATLYVEGDNVPALGLYRSLGFTDRLVDVQYRRR